MGGPSAHHGPGLWTRLRTPFTRSLTLRCRVHSTHSGGRRWEFYAADGGAAHSPAPAFVVAPRAIPLVRSAIECEGARCPGSNSGFSSCLSGRLLFPESEKYVYPEPRCCAWR